MKKEKNTSLEEKKVSFKDSDFVENGDRANLGTFGNRSWNLVWHEGYAGKYFVIFLIIIGISLVAGILDWILTSISGVDPEYSISIFSDIAGIVLAVGLLCFSINIAKGLTQKVGDLFRGITWERIWKIFCVTIIIGIIICLCCLLFILSFVRESGVNIVLLILGIISIVFGIFIGTRFNFAQYAVIDKGYGPKEALIYSRNITKGHFWEIVLFYLYFSAINILGMLCLLAGLVWTISMTYLATAKYYEILSKLYENGLDKK